MNPFLLLIIFNLCHWAGDYTHLSTNNMLAAKAKGTPIQPIMEHAFVHACMVFFVVFIFYYPDWWLSFIFGSFQWVTHFFIDLLKGRLNHWFHRLSDHTNKFHWYVFGADQYLHQLVIIFTVYFLTK